MKILSMDLSLSCPAFAVLEVKHGVAEILHLSHVKTNAKKSHGYRLFEIYNHMRSILETHKDIDVLVREKGFSRFPAVTQTLFKVVGINDICAYKYGFDKVEEVSVTTVKKHVGGHGKASKDEVARGIAIYVADNIKFKTDDESDAVAVGLTYLIQKKVLV